MRFSAILVLSLAAAPWTLRRRRRPSCQKPLNLSGKFYLSHLTSITDPAKTALAGAVFETEARCHADTANTESGLAAWARLLELSRLTFLQPSPILHADA